MLNNKKTQTEIAVRFFQNNTYGTSYAKGKFRKAIYNGTIDAKHINLKYLIDLYSYEDWANTAKTDSQMEILENITSEADTLYSWMKYYDPNTKEKQMVTGMCQINMDSMKVMVLIFDEIHGVEDRWDITARPCKQSTNGLKTPQLLATNGDLDSW
jgi:hypothetical protein